MYKEVKKVLALSLMATMLFTTIGFTSNVFAQTIETPQFTSTGRVIRWAGQDRYATAEAVALDGQQHASVILVSGGSYADAISATTLSNLRNAPILLTDQGSQTLNPYAKDALAKINVTGIQTTVYVIGGTGVITPAVRTELRMSGYRLVELGGLNRYETNVQVANELVAFGVKTTDVMMVGGENYPDALSVAPIASSKKEILLLANTSITASKPAVDFVNNKKSNVNIIGTINEVGNQIRSEIIGDTTRLDGGNTRYDTNKIILDAYATDLKFSKICITSGEDYPDALVASPMAGYEDGPLILVNTDTKASTYKTSTDFALNYLKTNSHDTTSINVIGGNGVVSDDFVTAINTTLK